ncbi:CBS domain-containing protein [Bdellovibrio svalbardensis]|uniref:CBS domain-containing protein n=1 Tax=Bdellovibrio svalbardensis TaxID=2972972 RepID=A0ABT6DEC9_9BACT|nr:CBS domain-containing protein [Bdellovibrio svalbardensis]MDG0815181.1 CBS domain-containing protein [Bdellovibrio svalbardensis]
MTSHPAQTKDVMTRKVVSIPIGRSMVDAVEVMQELRVRHLPVVDNVGKIVGVLTGKDFSHIKELSKYNVETFMSVPVEWVSQDMPLREAIKRMIEKKISCLLIGDDKPEVVGIVTAEDLMWFLANRLEQEEKKHSPLTLFDVQSLDEIANQISLTGL